MKVGDKFKSTKCPICESVNLQYSSGLVDYVDDKPYYVQAVKCLDCDTEFEDRYLFKHSVVKKIGELRRLGLAGPEVLSKFNGNYEEMLSATCSFLCLKCWNSVFFIRDTYSVPKVFGCIHCGARIENK